MQNELEMSPAEQSVWQKEQKQLRQARISATVERTVQKATQKAAEQRWDYQPFSTLSIPNYI